MSHVRRFDHVGLTVADLDVATAFFVALGLEVEGRTFVEGEFLDTVCGIPDSRTEIVMLKPPDDGTRLELEFRATRTPCPAHRPPWPTNWDCATWPSRSTTCRRLSIGQLPRATAGRWHRRVRGRLADGLRPRAGRDHRLAGRAHRLSLATPASAASRAPERSSPPHGGLPPTLDGVPHMGGVLRAPGAKHLEVEVLLESLEQPLPATQHERCGGDRELVDHTRRKALADERHHHRARPRRRLRARVPSAARRRSRR